MNYVDDDGFTALLTVLQVENSCQLKQADPTKSAEDAAALTSHLRDLRLAERADINRGASLGETVLHFLHGTFPQPSSGISLPAAQTLAPLTRNHLPADDAKSAKRWEVAALSREAME